MKKTISRCLPFLVVLCFGLFPLCVSKSQGIQVEAISSRSYHAIQAAMPELERRKLDVNDYRITVVETSSSLSVLFHDPEAPPGHERRPGRPPDLTIGLDKVDFAIIRSQLH
jgi:hypothetical protein